MYKTFIIFKYFLWNVVLIQFYFYLICLQLFRLNTKGQLGVGERCIAADRQNVKLVVCPLGTVDGPWQYESVSIIYNYFLLI